MDQMDLAAEHPAVAENDSERRPCEMEEKGAPEGEKDRAGMAEGTEMKKEEPEEEIGGLKEEPAEETDVLKEEPAAVISNKEKPSICRKENSLVRRRHSSRAAAEGCQCSLTAPGPAILPENVVEYYKQFGLNDREVQFIFQAHAAEVPAKPELLPAGLEAGKVRKSR